MMSNAIKAGTILDFALLQSAAECYLDGLHSGSTSTDIKEKLIEGANNAQLQGKSPDDPLLSGATRFTDTQAEWFTSNYEIVTHYPNDSSGFSATLFKHKTTGEYTLSFRSTEYQLQAKGGDYERDGSDATDGDISGKGYALAQLSSMETFYAHLKQGETFDTATGQWVSNAAVAAFAGGTPTLNVTGYSLGAHLSTSFTLLHSADVAATWNFNAAGIGGIVTADYDNAIPTGTAIKSLIDFYDTLMHYDGHVPDNPLWAKLVLASPFLGDFINTASAVQDIFIEDLPMSRGFGLLELLSTSVRDLVDEFVETHSVVPLTDSLTVLSAMKASSAKFPGFRFAASGLRVLRFTPQPRHVYSFRQIAPLALAA